MAKYSGQIGFVMSIEDKNKPGFWRDVVSKRRYYGDIDRHQFKNTNPNSINGEVTLSNTITVVADKYAIANLGYMKFIEYEGVSWSITNIDVKYPRLTIHIGGIYNGNTVSTGTV